MKKKIMAIIISTAMVLTMVGCGKSEPAEESTKTAEEVKEEQIRAEIEDEATEGPVEALVEEVIINSDDENKSNAPHKIDDISDEDMAVLVDECYDELTKYYEHTSTVAAAYLSQSTEDGSVDLYLILDVLKSDGTQVYKVAIQNVVHYNEDGKIDSMGAEIISTVVNSVDESKDKILDIFYKEKLIDEKVYN